MSWIALFDADTQAFHPQGLYAPAEAGLQIGPHEDDLLVRGTLVLETRLPNTSRPRPLLHYDCGGEWPFHLSLQAIPGGGLILILNQSGSVLHRSLNVSEHGRTDILRLSYCWDAPARQGWLALEQNDRDSLALFPISDPSPLRAGDLRALFKTGPHRFMAPDVIYMALSSRIEPVGPMPSLRPDTPIATPHGYRPLRDLHRGDTVLTAKGETVPILHRVNRTVPARGTTSPLHIRAPYFGLQQDIHVAPVQQLLLTGSEVEYLFGTEAVLTPAQHLSGGSSVRAAPCGPLVTYSQLLLPRHETILAAGAMVQSLYIGRLHHKPASLAASILTGLEHYRLPDHARAGYPVLQAFDAHILAERRVA